MRRNALELVAAGVAAMLVGTVVLFYDRLRRRVEFAATSAGIVDPDRVATAP